MSNQNLAKLLNIEPPALAQVLPALQLVLMWRAFLPGFTSATAAFWVGAACWGLFTVAALVYWARNGFGSGYGCSNGAGGARIDSALACGGNSGGTTHYIPQVQCLCRRITLPSCLPVMAFRSHPFRSAVAPAKVSC